MGWITVIYPPFTMRLKRSGFSLVLSLTIMAAMVLMVIVLASFLQIESRLAQGHSGYLRARYNALAAARIAIGQLQQLAGPDQRVTMRADMYADNDVAVGATNATTINALRGTSTHSNNNAPIGGKLAHQKRYLTGVWATGGVTPTIVRDWDVSNPTDSRLFLGWLASPFEAGSSPELAGPNPNYVPNSSLIAPDANYFNRRKANMGAEGADITGNPPFGQALINQLGTNIADNVADLVPLVSYGTVNLPNGLSSFQRNHRGAVDARPQPMPGPSFADGKSLGANGRYAFWIGDEGVKAKINLPDYYAVTLNGRWLSNENWDKGFAASANQRNSLGVIGAAGDTLKEGINIKGQLPTGFDFDTWRTKDILANEGNPQGYQLSKAVGNAGLSAWAANQGGLAAGQAMNDAAKILWHDITTLAYSTLTDTYSGGVKIDLSTAFELPYTMYRGIETYPGQKDSTITGDIRLRRQSLFNGAPNASPSTPTVGNAGLAVDLDYNRPNLVDKLGSPSELLRASPRASEWAPRYLNSLLGTSYTQLKTRNGGETPERLGFVYEAPLRNAFYAEYLGPGNSTISRILANTEQSPNATVTTWTATTFNTLTMRSNVLPWPEITGGTMDTIRDHAENLTGRIIRGPTWDLYRNYYRMYKREVEEAGKSSGALRGQEAAPADAVVARGVEPLSYATGNRTRPVQRTPSNFGTGATSAQRTYAPPPDNFYAGGGSLDPNRYFYRSNFSAPSDAPSFQAEQRLRYPNILKHLYQETTAFGGTNPIVNFDRMGLAKPSLATNDAYFDNLDQNCKLTTRTWPTSMSLSPSIVRFSMVFSGVFDNNITTDTLGNVSLGTIGVTVDPVVMVHNPYDVAIEFEGIAMVTNADSLPYIFDIQLQDWIVRDTHNQYFDPTPGGGARTSQQYEPLPVDTTPNSRWEGELIKRTLTLGEIAVGDGAQENRTVSFRLVNPGQKFRLEPGEIKTISTKYIGSDYESNRSINTVITTTDFGYDLGSNAVYRMTPFYNVRYRSNGNDISTQFKDWPIPSAWNARAEGDARLWTWGFMPNRKSDGKRYDPPTPTGLGQPPKHGFFGNWCYNNSAGLANPSAFHDALDLWNDVKNQRRIRDGLPGWTGDARSLRTILQFPPNGNLPTNITFTARNSGWLNYDNRVVGEEGVYGQPGYVFPRLRSGTTAVGGNQRWNFYLLNNKSIDGQALNPSRRWFGSPRTETPTFNPSTQTLANYQNEGSLTTGGQHLVDESLLLNFQALTAGWPHYGNDNGHWNNIIQYNEEWLSLIPGGLPRPPDYRIATGLKDGLPVPYTGRPWRGDSDISGTEVSFGPEKGDPEFGRPEITSGRANSLGGRIKGYIFSDRGDTKQPFFLTDFVLRSAEMTGRTLSTWYPASATDTVFQFDGVASSGLVNSVLKTPPDVIQAPMSPFFLSVRPQQAHLFGYDGKAHTPIGWVLSQRKLTSEPQMSLAANNANAYWGASVSPSTNQRADTILFPIPRRPLLSLAQLGSAGFAQVNTDADLTVGASFAHPGIMDRTQITDWPGPKLEDAAAPEDKAIPENGWVAIHSGTRIIRNVANVRTDHAFAANLALWDSYYFSGLNLPANSYSLPGETNAFPGGADLPTDSAIRTAQAAALSKAAGNPGGFNPSSFQDLKTALEAGFNPLANKRVIFQPDNKPAVADGAFPLPTEFPHPTYLARNALYDGGFNVNSTSKQAWKAVLAGMRGQTLPDGSSTPGTVLTRFARSFQPSTGGNDTWNNYRELTDAEIDRLAAEVVKEVRDRGPFMSLGDFVNRRLLNTDHGLKGPLQAALDKSGINNAAIGSAAGILANGTFAAPAALNLNTSFDDPNQNWGRPFGLRNNYNNRNGDGDGSLGVLKKATNPTAARFPNIASMSQTNDPTKVTAGLGAPKIVTQMDVLNTVGPNLTARSDTFTIRAYGEALDNAGNTIGRAWVEVVVQRSTQFMLPSARGPAYEEMNRRKSAYRGTGNAAAITPLLELPVVDPYESNLVTAGNPNAAANYRLPTNATLAERETWNINRLLGRRFKATATRWLNANEI